MSTQAAICTHNTANSAILHIPYEWSNAWHGLVRMINAAPGCDMGDK